jgi:tRNA(Leu) C34 or U34 (ribose-2'-O)-methylase TrmL
MGKGFASVGLVRPKDTANVGAILRASYCFDVSLIAIEGDRTPIRSHVDTPKAWRHIPVIRNDDLSGVIPYDAVPVAVDLVDDAEDLRDFVHPERAFYVFGPEDGTLGHKHLQFCHKRVMLPSRTCLNLASCVGIVLYDRLLKQKRK